MIDSPTLFAWPPDSSRDAVAREIDQQSIPASQRRLLRFLFDQFWPVDSAADYRPGQRMQPMTLAALAAGVNGHINSVRTWLSGLAASGYIGQVKQSGNPQGDLIGIAWGKFYGCEMAAVVPPQSPTVGVQPEIVPLQKNLVGVQQNVVPPQSKIVGVQDIQTCTPTILDVLNQLQSDNALLRGEIQAMREELAAFREEFRSGNATAKTTEKPVCASPTVGVQPQIVPLQLDPYKSAHDHEFMKNNHSFMSHDHEGKGTTPVVPLQRIVPPQKNVVGVQIPPANFALPDPYFTITAGQLRTDYHVDAILSMCVERKYWPPGEQGRLEFFALVEFAINGDDPGASLRGGLSIGYHRCQPRIRQGLDRARQRLGLATCPAAGATTPAAQPVARPANVAPASLSEMSEDDIRRILANDYWAKAEWINAKNAGEDPRQNKTVIDAVLRSMSRPQLAAR